jgi:AhpD family alkylhydroperoxidase
MHAARIIEDLREPTRTLRHAVPDAWRAFGNLREATMAPGALDVRTKELLALAISVAKGCDGCIAYHAKGAAAAGATREEVAEALAVVLLMDGGPATAHAPRAFASFLEFDPHDPLDRVDEGTAADGG